MFTKEKLEKWIKSLCVCSFHLASLLEKALEDNAPYEEILLHQNNLFELKTALEQLHTSITSDGSI